MNFTIILIAQSQPLLLPINYQYPLSAAIYRIISKGDQAYASFLHEQGYGKGFKLFTFSDINVPFVIEGDRMKLHSDEVRWKVSFHLPKAMESFVKGLFQSETMDIADKKSKVSFRVKSIESLPNPLITYRDQEIVSITCRPLSPIVAGIVNEQNYYDFLSPEDPRFTESLIYNWRSKIESCIDASTSANALLMMEVNQLRLPPKSRLSTIKADTSEETKIRGWKNFELKITGEKRFVELLLNAGVGLYNAQGMGCVEVK